MSFARREITDEEQLDAALHVENLPDEGDLQVKVAFVTNGDLIARIPRDMPSKLLVKQLALKNWKSASSTILQHKELLEEVQDKILKEMSKGKAKTGLHGLPMWFLWSHRIILSKPPNYSFALTSMSLSDFPLLQDMIRGF